MNYRHAYHAGNFADVVKHIVLLCCLAHLKLKPAAFRVLDTHAGRGLYDLSSVPAAKTDEWRAGAGRVLAAYESAPAAVQEVLTPWLNALRGRQPTGLLSAPLGWYPGSPVLIADQLRADDSLYAVERHPEEREALAKVLERDRRVRIPDIDGWQAVRSLLPPSERRGLVLIDPPFEQAGELQRLATALDEGLERFRGGIYLLWYPIKDPKPVARFRRQIRDIAARHEVETVLAIELLVRAPRHPDLLNGAGLVVVNPPYTLEHQMNKVLPWLASVLGETREAGGEVLRLS